jgi:hypothetical protein
MLFLVGWTYMNITYNIQWCNARCILNSRPKILINVLIKIVSLKFTFMLFLMEVFQYILNKSGQGEILLDRIEWYIQGGWNMTGTNCDLFTHKSSRSYLNHLVHTFPAGGLDVDERAKMCHQLHEMKELCWQK